LQRKGSWDLPGSGKPRLDFATERQFVHANQRGQRAAQAPQQLEVRLAAYHFARLEVPLDGHLRIRRNPDGRPGKSRRKLGIDLARDHFANTYDDSVDRRHTGNLQDRKSVVEGKSV